MNSQRGMWAEAWVQGVAARKFVALAVFGELVNRASAEWFATPSIAGVFTSAILWACLAYIIHARILLPANCRNVRNIARMFGFAVPGIVVGALIAIIGGIILYTATTNYIHSLAFVIVMFGLLTLPALILIATILPAYVAGRAYGLRESIARGKVQFFWIAGRMLVGPVLLACLSANLYWRVANHLRSFKKPGLQRSSLGQRLDFPTR